MDIDLNAIGQKLMEMAIEFGPSLLLAIVVLLIGLRVIKVVQKMIRKAADKGQLDPNLRTFLSSLAGWILKILLFIAVAEMIGVKTTSFIAILGAAGLAIGLALQGTLANFAGGVLILIFKPFKVGDFIRSQGENGVVKEIQIFNTILITPQNRTLIMPNGALMNNHIENYTQQGTLRVDMSIGISYSSDIKKAKEVLMNLIHNEPRILKDPEPFVGVNNLADSAVELVVRPWTTADDHWPVYFDFMENAKIELEKNGIGIPFPQRDVHLYQH